VIDPALVARIADLELVARIVVDGTLSGLHRSPFHGYSAEFSQYRHYRPGDDLKYIDWKLAARTGRLYTKQFRETTNLAATIVLDSSASMNFPLAGPLSKFRYAASLTAALAYLISSQGDLVGLTARDTFIGARGGKRHLQTLLAALSSLSPSGECRLDTAVRLAADRLRGRGLLIVMSDLYDDEERTFAALRLAARSGHEVAILHIVSRQEIEFPYAHDVEFVDLESGRRVALDASAARREYADNVAAFVERWRTRAGREGMQYALGVTDMPLDRMLRSFLLARA
jgi:uncharacterized protein (DUF58 family)